MPSEKPVIVVVPGAWSAPAAYRKLVEELEAASFSVKVPELPTNNGARPPNSSYESDVAVVREVVRPLVEDGKMVFMLMHSYGGAVGTEAVQGLALKDRQALNLPGGVVHLFYLSAYLLSKGQNVWKVVEKSGIGDKMTGYVTIEEDGTWLPNDAVWAMYHDLDPEDQEEQKNLIKPHNLSSVYSEPTYEGWRDIPSTYVYTTEDRWVPPIYQDICIANAKEAGVPLDIKIFNCAHSAYAKFPKEVTALVKEITSST